MTVYNLIVLICIFFALDSGLDEYISKLGWAQDATGVVEITPNPDNKIVSTVVQENINLPRTFIILSVSANPFTEHGNTVLYAELSKVISHVIQAA